MNIELLNANNIRIKRQYVMLPYNVVEVIDNSNFGNVLKAKTLYFLNHIIKSNEQIVDLPSSFLG